MKSRAETITRIIRDNNTANYCPVPLLKISIRKYGTYAVTICPHLPRVSTQIVHINFTNA